MTVPFGHNIPRGLVRARKTYSPNWNALRGTPAAGPCAHVHRDPSEVSGGLRDRISKREERHSDGPLVWQRAEFHGRALLGPWIRSVHSGLELEQVRKYIREQVAAKLVDGPVGESPTRVTCPVAPVVISGGGAGDQSVGSPEVKVLVGWA